MPSGGVAPPGRWRKLAPSLPTVVSDTPYCKDEVRNKCSMTLKASGRLTLHFPYLRTGLVYLDCSRLYGNSRYRENMVGVRASTTDRM